MRPEFGQHILPAAQMLESATPRLLDSLSPPLKWCVSKPLHQSMAAIFTHFRNVFHAKILCLSLELLYSLSYESHPIELSLLFCNTFSASLINFLIPEHSQNWLYFCFFFIFVTLFTFFCVPFLAFLCWAKGGERFIIGLVGHVDNESNA